MFLLDTDILSNLLKKAPSPHLIRTLAQTPVDQQFTSSINLGEMAYGAYRLTNGEALLKKILENINTMQILPFDYEASLIYGRLRGELGKKGTTVPEADLRIGSIALSRDMMVVTGNKRHYSFIPNLKIDNWL